MKAILLLLALTSACYGRLGDTLHECRKRYGKLSLQQPGIYMAEKGDIIIILGFGADGKVGSIKYGKFSEKLKRSVPLPMAEIKKFLEENRGGGKWETVGKDVIENDDAIARWVNLDSKPICLAKLENPTMLMIETKEHIDIHGKD